MDVNIFDFDAEHPDPSVFDVSDCYSESEKIKFQIHMGGEWNFWHLSYYLWEDYDYALLLRPNNNSIYHFDFKVVFIQFGTDQAAFGWHHGFDRIMGSIQHILYFLLLF